MSSTSAPDFLEPPLNSPLHLQHHPPTRFAGDGLDFRRPAVTTNVAQPSRASVDVIDLTVDEGESDSAFLNTRQLPPLNFSSESTNALFTRHAHSRRRPEEVHRNTSDVVDLEGSNLNSAHSNIRTGTRLPSMRHEDSDDSDVVYVGEREVAAPNEDRASAGPSRIGDQARSGTSSRQTPRPANTLGDLGDLLRQGTRSFFTNGIHANVLPLFQQVGFSGPSFMVGFNGSRRGHRNPLIDDRDSQEFEAMADLAHGRMRPTRLQNFPQVLNFERQGFELINPDHEDEMEAHPTRRQDSPPYKAPSAPPEGFTRKLEEETFVVCPNCGQELGRRDYNDLKRQVWVVKACGHVYCGECTKNRSIRAKLKNASSSSSNTPTFKRCVVEGCDKPVHSRTAMLQIYL